MSNGNAQMAGVHRLAVVDESLLEVLGERDSEFAPDLERLADLYNHETECGQCEMQYRCFAF